MGPSRTHRSKYNFSKETLTGQLLCPHCSKKFKTQGFKKHKGSCKKHKDTKAEQAVFAIQYERDQRREPWHPFCSRGDFEFAEITLNAALNKSQIDGLLALIMYETHALPLWDWALDLLANPLLAPDFVWDAQCVFKHNGREFEHFYNEPWMGDRWWDSCLPNGLKATPFCFILYADKTRLLSHGTVKGYPVVVRCTNLPVSIWNGEGIGSGHVSEDADEEGKPGFVNLRCVVWHEAFLKLLELIVQYSKSGYSHNCYDKIMRWLFPILLILSADYEEQCMMSLIRGHHSKCPCPVCLVPLEELSELSKTSAFRSVEEAIAALNVYKVSKARGEELLKALGLRANVFWLIAHSDPHQAISFDRLHALHLGMWKHLLEELKKILKALGRDAESEVEKHTVIHITFSDGNKMQDLSKQAFYSAVNVLKQRTSPEGYTLLHIISSYLQLDSYIGLNVHTTSTLAAIDAELLNYIECALNSPIEGLKLDWDFPKAHLWKHATRDIRMKGAVRNYSTRPNEKLHGPLKEAYERQSNGKDIADQILRVDQRKFAVKMLRGRMDTLDEQHILAREGDDDDEVPNPVAFEGHIKLGSTQQPVAIQDIENHRGQLDRASQGFHKKFSNFINNSLPTYGYRLERWVTIPANFLIHEHRFLKVNYDPQFHRQPHYDCALIQLTQEVSVFVHLVFIFKCQLLDVGSFEFVLVQPFTAGIGASRRSDHDLRLTRVKAVPRASSIFVPVQSLIRGAVCFPDPDHQDEFFVVDHIDSDMFLCMKSHPARQ
ncbi:hypothetical protein EV702DRAFT_1181527 [Suillus placidus]|uniref:Uncharacterized protein n=1 Tax=Suillus placidus TaxID=48579 RepID=A0A9P7CYP3_9AGAM|nr:hypothetical protein EV702DRAFT_1181527 [Suillus placidus]